MGTLVRRRHLPTTFTTLATRFTSRASRPTRPWLRPPLPLLVGLPRQDGTALLELLKQSLARRGVKGVTGLSKKFLLLDDDGNGELSLDEFAKVLLQVPDLQWKR